MHNQNPYGAPPSFSNYATVNFTNYATPPTFQQYNHIPDNTWNNNYGNPTFPPPAGSPCVIDIASDLQHVTHTNTNGTHTPANPSTYPPTYQHNTYAAFDGSNMLSPPAPVYPQAPNSGSFTLPSSYGATPYPAHPQPPQQNYGSYDYNATNYAQPPQFVPPPQQHDIHEQQRTIPSNSSTNLTSGPPAGGSPQVYAAFDSSAFLSSNSPTNSPPPHMDNSSPSQYGALDDSTFSSTPSRPAPIPQAGRGAKPFVKAASEATGMRHAPAPPTAGGKSNSHIQPRRPGSNLSQTDHISSHRRASVPSPQSNPSPPSASYVSVNQNTLIESSDDSSLPTKPSIQYATTDVSLSGYAEPPPLGGSGDGYSSKLSQSAALIAEKDALIKCALRQSMSVNTPRWEIDYNSLEVGDVLGSGAFGVVNKGRWRKTVVAIKTIRESAMKMSKSELESFKEEAEMMMNMRPHTNVIQFFGVCIQPEYPLVIVVEFLSGGNLYDLLHSKDVAIHLIDAVKVCLGAAAGMEHLHQEGICHRDLAARNILLTNTNLEYCTVKICDFGMSRFAEESEEKYTTTKVGPIKWMPPESIRYHKYSSKSDVWAFGVLLWEVFARREPFPGMDPVAVAIEVVSHGGRLSPPLSCPASVADLMRDCWADDPHARPAFADIYNRLEGILDEAFSTNYEIVEGTEPAVVYKK